ncbi:hypothetical protein [Corynebacterium glaucum]|uniref:hypothetical protein n=1 Tax=Corynebacterium glaucum TaxID=187491 RepID=UPI00265A51D1|nr:hypothetical protein [Corynebacterium glaucum]
MRSPAMDYILGTLLILLAAASFTFLSGSTAVFIGIFGAVAGAVFIVRGIQANDTPQDPRQVELDSLNEQFDAQYGGEMSQDYDWDAHYQRNFGQGNADGVEGGRR